MKDVVFYLKYRSQKIAELDLADVREGLLKMVKSKKVPHALLFTGPRGSGKTSAARIIAKILNCESKRKGSPEPCNRCQICRSITEGTSLDLMEIDAASTRGIDDIRNLREKVKLAPTQLKNKVYIIDEVHMLTTEAFNALLKTLEEPPANTYFILCTTEPEKLPETIVSRCTHFNFRKGKVEEVIGSLKRVVKGEKMNVAKGVLEEIAKGVDGSFRDAQKILDQLSSGRKKITLKEAKELLGKIEELSPKKILGLLSQKEMKKSLLEIDRIVTSGGDLGLYAQELLERLRLGLLSKAGLAEVSEPEETVGFDLHQIRTLIELFAKAAREIKTNPIPQLPLELAVVEWCQEEKSTPSEPVAPNPGTEKVIVISPKQTSSKGDLGKVQACWSQILTSIRPLNHSVEALLRASRPLAMSGEILTLEVFYQFHKERLEEEKCRAIFEETAGEVLGMPIRLKCVLGEKKPVVARQEEERVDNPEDSDIIKTAEEIFGSNAN